MKLYFIIKRLIDIVASLILLLILSPILIITSILVYLKLGSPIFFIQERVGKNNKVFKMIKFRSMRDVKNKFGEDLPDEDRLTSFGQKLRSYSIDELPELLNILNGDMSLVGPRPLLVDYLELYSDEQIRRHEMKPGITGLAQINGRNSISWNDRLKLDINYIDSCSLFLDIKILFMTVYKVIKRDGISQEGNATMERFKGNN